MAEQGESGEVLRQHLSELGRKGGKAMTPAKRQQLARARVAREFYRRNPGEHPSRKQQQ